MSEEKEEVICIKCGECCKNFFFKMKIDAEKNLIDYLEERHKHPHGYWVLEPNGVIVLILNVPCDHLDEKNKCDTYDNRPVICQKYYCAKAKNPKK